MMSSPETEKKDQEDIQMKKILALMITFVMAAALSGAAFAAEDNIDPDYLTIDSVTMSTPDDGPQEVTPEGGLEMSGLPGGWSVFEDGTEYKLPDEVKEAFDKAMEEYDGMNLTPIALLGSQVVAGRNYQILCSGAPVVPDPQPGLYVAVIYLDLQENAAITNVVDFDLGKIEESARDAEAPAERLAGGWSAPDAPEGTALPEDAATAFSAAIQDQTDVSYIPAALLGTKVIAGTEYAFLAYATPETQDPISYYAVIFCAANVDGTCDLMSIVPLDLAIFNKRIAEEETDE